MSEQPIALTARPEGYGTWLADLKNRIHQAQQRATLAVNRELLLFYWQIGKRVLPAKRGNPRLGDCCTAHGFEAGY